MPALILKMGSYLKMVSGFFTFFSAGQFTSTHTYKRLDAGFSRKTICINPGIIQFQGFLVCTSQAAVFVERDRSDF
jgi:hypothetical protein